MRVVGHTGDNKDDLAADGVHFRPEPLRPALTEGLSGVLRVPPEVIRHQQLLSAKIIDNLVEQLRRQLRVDVSPGALEVRGILWVVLHHAMPELPQPTRCQRQLENDR